MPTWWWVVAVVVGIPTIIGSILMSIDLNKIIKNKISEIDAKKKDKLPS